MFFLKAVNVIQILLASFCKHFIGSLIKKSFLKINITSIKPSSNQMGVNLQNHKNIVSAIPLSFSIKNNETNINGPIFCKIIMFCFFFKSHIEAYAHIGPVVDYPKQFIVYWRET